MRNANSRTRMVCVVSELFQVVRSECNILVMRSGLCLRDEISKILCCWRRMKGSPNMLMCDNALCVGDANLRSLKVVPQTLPSSKLILNVYCFSELQFARCLCCLSLSSSWMLFELFLCSLEAENMFFR